MGFWKNLRAILRNPDIVAELDSKSEQNRGDAR